MSDSYNSDDDDSEEMWATFAQRVDEVQDKFMRDCRNIRFSNSGGGIRIRPVVAANAMSGSTAAERKANCLLCNSDKAKKGRSATGFTCIECDRQLAVLLPDEDTVSGKYIMRKRDEMAQKLLCVWRDGEEGYMSIVDF